MAVLHHPVQPRADDENEVGLAHGGAAGGLEGYYVVFADKPARHGRGVERRGGEIHELGKLFSRAGEEGAAAREYHRAF